MVPGGCPCGSVVGSAESWRPVVIPLVSLLLAFLSEQASASAGRQATERLADALRRGVAVDPKLAVALSGHPAEQAILDYLARPSLAGWRDIRGYLLVPDRLQPASGALRLTLWEAVTWWEWASRTGRYERPPFSWATTDPRAYPDESGTYPPPDVVQLAMAAAMGLFLPVPPDFDDEPRFELAPPMAPGPAQRPGHFVVYEGRNDVGPFWEGAPVEVGTRLALIHRSGRFPGWTAYLLNGEDVEVLGTYLSDRSLTWRQTGALSLEETVRQLDERHGIAVVFSDERHWKPRKGKSQVLVDGPMPR